MEQLRDIERLSERVVRVLGQNGSAFTLQGTNCYLVGTGDRRALIDTGSGLEAFQALLRKAMLEHGIQQIALVLLTHHHIDHIGGIKRLLRDSTIFVQPLVVYVADVASVWKETDKAVEYRQAHPGQVLAVEGATLECWSSPGHTSDSMCLWLHEEAALFSGDTVLGEGKSPVIDNLGEYLATLRDLIRRLASHTQPVRIYPGHGQMIEDGVLDVDRLISRRLGRNAEILDLLKSRPMTAVELVTTVYEQVPPELRLAALGSIQRHLEYLLAQGLCKSDGKKFEASTP
jgi:ribonuclease/clavin/mitogillin